MAIARNELKDNKPTKVVAVTFRGDTNGHASIQAPRVMTITRHGAYLEAKEFDITPSETVSGSKLIVGYSERSNLVQGVLILGVVERGEPDPKAIARLAGSLPDIAAIWQAACDHANSNGGNL
jgi:hypothetical protein